jgi:hypothetical protein
VTQDFSKIENEDFVLDKQHVHRAQKACKLKGTGNMIWTAKE